MVRIVVAGVFLLGSGMLLGGCAKGSSWISKELPKELAVSHRADLLSAQEAMAGRLLARLDGSRIIITTHLARPAHPSRCLVELLGPTGQRVLPLRGEGTSKQLELLRLGLKRCLGAPRLSPPPYIVDRRIGVKVIHPDSTNEGSLLVALPAKTPVHMLARLGADAFYANFDAVGYLVATPRGKAAQGVLWQRFRCMAGLLPRCSKKLEPRLCRGLVARVSPVAKFSVDEMIRSDGCDALPRSWSKATAASFEQLVRQRSSDKAALRPCIEATIFGGSSAEHPLAWQRIVHVGDRLRALGYRFFDIHARPIFSDKPRQSPGGAAGPEGSRRGSIPAHSPCWSASGRRKLSCVEPSSIRSSSRSTARAISTPLTRVPSSLSRSSIQKRLPVAPR